MKGNEMPDGGIVKQDFNEAFGLRYAEFAVSANARSLPNLADGLKPVHRRILYSVMETAPPNGAPKKCARLVGDCMGKYHPHGDSSIYDALARMTLDFVTSLRLIEGQGNFGAVTGDAAASMRYPEAKTSQLAAKFVLEGVFEGAVPMAPNYDETLSEPEVLPVKVPLLLINGAPDGSMGSGFSSSIPPHNAGEICEAAKVLIERSLASQDFTVADFMAIVPGPDLPGGGTVSGLDGLAQFYATGSGSAWVRGEAEIETGSSPRIIITQIPYGSRTQDLAQQIADLGKDQPDKSKKGAVVPAALPEIREARDETSVDHRTRETQIRIVVELKQGSDAKAVLQKLFKMSGLETTLKLNMTGIGADGRVTTVGAIQALETWADHRIACIRRQSVWRLERDNARIHTVDGLLLALPRIDEVVRTIKAAADAKAATADLQKIMPVTSKQAAEIVEMRLSRLTGLKVNELKAERKELGELVPRWQMLAGDIATAARQVIEELTEAKAVLGRPRRTTISGDGRASVADPRSFVAAQRCVITLSADGFLRRAAAGLFRAQGRGGKGAGKAKPRDEDKVQRVISCHTHDRVLAVTSRGAFARCEAFEAPEAGSGSHARNFLTLNEGESVAAVVATSYPPPAGKSLMVVAENGQVKRVALAEAESRQVRRVEGYTGEGRVVAADIVEDGSQVIIATEQGVGIRFEVNEVRLTHRNSGGMRGINLKPGNKVVSMCVLGRSPDERLICINSEGFGYKVKPSEVPLNGRGTGGRTLLKLKTDRVKFVAAIAALPGEHLLVVTKGGMTLRLPVADVLEYRRGAFGRKILDLTGTDKIASIAVIPVEEQ